MPDREDTAPNVLIVATSLRPKSRSFILAEYALERLRERYPDVTADLIDLRSVTPMPLAGSPDADTEEAQAVLAPLFARMRQATHVLLAVPIYNFGVGAAAKNLVELMVPGDIDLEGKAVGFLCSAGGLRSYMSVLGLANSLMLDFRTWIVPRFVYATGSDFTDGQMTGMEVSKRVEQLLEEMFEHGPRPAVANG
jgi:FMN reductase